MNASPRLSVFRRRKRRRRPPASPGADVPRRGVLGLLAAGGLLWGAVLILFYVGGQVSHTELTVGQRSRNTVVATVGFTCPDMPRTELLRRQAADEVPPVFAIDAAGLNTAVRSLSKLGDRVASLRQPADPPLAPEDLRTLLTDDLFLLGVPITADDALALFPTGRETDVQSAVRIALEETWNQGIVSAREQQTRFDGVASTGYVTLMAGGGQPGRPVPIGALLPASDAVSRAAESVQTALADVEAPSVPLAAMLRQWLVPNLRYDAAQTDALRAEAARRVEVVHQQVSPGTTLVDTGERITPQIMAAILAHEQKRAELESRPDRILDRVGHGALLLLGLVMVGVFGRVLAPAWIQNIRLLSLAAVLSLLVIAPARLLVAAAAAAVLPHSLAGPLVPLALGPLLGAVLIGGGPAVAIGLWSSFVVSLLFSHSHPMLVLGLVVSLVAAGSAQAIRRRSDLLRIGLRIGLAAMAVTLAFGALDQQEFSVLGPRLLAALLGGLVCALAAFLLIPAFEWLFGLTTDLTLLELSDMGHPLLQRLAIEAPGTYHHSLMLANLGQSAAVAIGANSLLVRVCAYFHDIGKLTKPEMFIENAQYTRNPHDDLSPSMSALVIVSHVKEGLALAQRHKLPPPIQAGIAQHHGSGLVYYFYHRALKQQEAQENGKSSRPVAEADFRYPGPKPQNREMGILLLADSVEAASRSMEKPSVSRIEALVHEICDVRLQDGQLDHCDLTFAQLTAIKRSFIFTLTTSLHGRPKYPKHESRDQQPAKPTPDKPQASGLVEPVAHGAG